MSDKKEILGQKFEPGGPKNKISKARKRLQTRQEKRDTVDKDSKNLKPKTPPPTVPAKPPSVFKMMKSFSTDLANYVKAGAPNCSEKDYKERLLTCDACPHLLRNMMRCGKCGCLVEHKAKWKTTTCPDNKWKAQDLSNLPKPKPQQGGKK
tara:strand:+ start:1585 stop:2037 length:453 start_codon:yes stop_codon:yes gene_type:complete